MTLKGQVEESCDFLRQQNFTDAEVGIILGTGLDGLIEEIEVEREVDYTDIPHFPVSTILFHKGKLVQGTLAGKKVLAMQGRFHYYEGYSMRQITYPLYVLREMGIANLLISNAAGNLNLDWKKGELMLIDDHINLQPANPLRGENDDYFGPRFPDMSAPYDKKMNAELEKLAVKLNVGLRKGVYVAVEGPNLETRAEYRYLRGIGADAVGMSTVPEVIVANYLGIPVSTISVLTDDCDPDHLEAAKIEEILAIAREAEKDLTKLFKALVASL